MKYTPFYWLNKESKEFLERGYLLPNVTAEQRIKEIADYAENLLGVDGFSDKFYDYMSRGWFSLASPIWSNYGLERGLPISCFGSYIGDTSEEILYAHAEVGMMTKHGGGTSGYFGALRPRGSTIKNNGTSNGSYAFAKLFDTVIDVFSQGTTRKGMFAGYIPVEHADIDEWLNIQKEGDDIQLMYYGVTITRQWFKEMKEGDKAKRKIWSKILQNRSEIGIPYISFIDNINDNTVDVYKDKNMKIYSQNLCEEISLPLSETESFVCCLSSMNVEHYDDWKDTDAVETLTFFLDSVMSDFITKVKDINFMERTLKFAERHRALGIGVLGFSSYLQSNMIAFDSLQATNVNTRIFKTLKEQTYAASEKLAQLFGEPELLKGYGRRNTTLMAIAPTKSSSFILGQVSPSIEPYTSNYYVKDLAKSKTTFKNPFLTSLLTEKGKNDKDTWKSIGDNNGSVQHLDFLTQDEKDVFKTFSEISQLAIIQLAAARQKYIDQGQSLNIMIHPDTPTKDLNKLYMQAEELGLSGFYYQNSINSAQEFNRELLNCSSCEA